MPDEQNCCAVPLLRQFLNLTGGSILYCLSALSIVYGIAQVLGPLLAQTDALREALPCIGALATYEIALLAVLLVIVLWRHVRDDAISLVVLVALFLVATALALSTVANSGPAAAFYIGLGCAGLGLAKLYTIRRYVGLDLGTLSFVAAALVLVSNCLGGAHFARLLEESTTGEVQKSQWLAGWLGLFAAGVLAILDSASRLSRRAKPVPFLNRPAMRVLFLVICLAASGIHQYTLAYIFDISSVFGDYLPLIGIVSLLMLRMCRDLRPKPGHFETVISWIPLAACSYAVISGAAIIPEAMGIAAVWHIPVFLGMMVCGLTGLWLRQYGRLPSATLAGYGGVFLLTVGCSAYGVHELNWGLFLWGTASALLIAGLVLQSLGLCFASVVAVTVSLAATSEFIHIVESCDLTPAGAVLGVYGLGTIALAILFRDEMPRTILRFGALCFMAALFDFFPQEFRNSDMFCVGATAALCVVLWARSRDWMAIAPLALPLLSRILLFVRHMSGWSYVVLSFVLLFVGGWVSVRKGGRLPHRA